jgi:hypothetical protein
MYIGKTDSYFRNGLNFYPGSCDNNLIFIFTHIKNGCPHFLLTMSEYLVLKPANVVYLTSMMSSLQTAMYIKPLSSLNSNPFASFYTI